MAIWQAVWRSLNSFLKNTQDVVLLGWILLFRRRLPYAVAAYTVVTWEASLLVALYVLDCAEHGREVPKIDQALVRKALFTVTHQERYAKFDPFDPARNPFHSVFTTHWLLLVRQAPATADHPLLPGARAGALPYLERSDLAPCLDMFSLYYPTIVINMVLYNFSYRLTNFFLVKLLALFDVEVSRKSLKKGTLVNCAKELAQAVITFNPVEHGLSQAATDALCADVIQRFSSQVRYRLRPQAPGSQLRNEQIRSWVRDDVVLRLCPREIYPAGSEPDSRWLDRLKVAELKEELRRRQQPVGGKKAELQKRLKDYLKQHEGGPAVPQDMVAGGHGMAALRGLANAGATCYMNSVLQVPFMNIGLRTAVLGAPIPAPDVRVVRFEAEAILYELQVVFASLQLRHGTVVTPHGFWGQFFWSDAEPMLLNTSLHRDPSHFLDRLGDLADRATQAAPDQPGIMQARLGGTIVHRHTILADGKVVETGAQYFRQLTLDIRNMPTLEEALSNYFCRPEPLTGGNQYNHEGELVDAERRAFIADVHDTFAIQLQRFELGDFLGSRKITAYLQYPQQLDLYPLSLQALEEAEGQVRGEPKPREYFKYELTAVVLHRGDTTTGHCFSTAKDWTTGEWYLFDDARVVPYDMANLSVDTYGGGWQQLLHTLCTVSACIIAGRAKDTIVLTNGENVEPQALEDLLCTSPYIQFAVLLGSGCRSLGALLVPTEEALDRAGGDVGSPAMQQLIKDELARTLLHRPPHERVRAFAVLADPFSVEDGTLTRTMKPRKAAVMGKYAQQVEQVWRQLR